MKFFISIFILACSAVAHAENSFTVKVGLAFRFEEAAQERFINSFSQGFDLAKKQFVKSHPNFKVEFIKYSHKRDPQSIRLMAQNIVKDEIHFVLGGESSDEVKEMKDTFEKSKVLLMTPTSSDPRVTQGSNYIFRACFSDDQTARSLAQFVNSELKQRAKSSVLGVVHNTGNSYTDFLTKSFTDELKKFPIKLITHKYAGENSDFNETVKDFAAKRTEAVVLFTGKDDFLRFVDYAQKLKLNPIYYGSDGWGTHQSVIENLGKSGLLPNFTGVLNSYWHEESDRPEVKQFIADYKAQFSRAPDGWSAIAYDSAKILFEAIFKGTTGLVPQSADVAKVLKATEFSGLVTTPKLKYENGNSPKKSLYLYEISANRANFKAAL